MVFHDSCLDWIDSFQLNITFRQITFKRKIIKTISKPVKSYKGEGSDSDNLKKSFYGLEGSQLGDFLTIFPCCGYSRLSTPWIWVLINESDCLLLVWGVCSRCKHRVVTPKNGEKPKFTVNRSLTNEYFIVSVSPIVIDTEINESFFSSFLDEFINFSMHLIS